MRNNSKVATKITTMKISRYVLIGLLFFGTLTILVWGLNFLKGKNFLQAEKVYYARYEKISGLMVSSPVTINGFQVGDVREIKLSLNDLSEILVRFVLTYPDISLPDGTIPRIYSTDLMGTKGIELLMGKSDQIIVLGDTIQGTIEGDLKDQVNTQMLPLKQKAEDLMASMDSVLLALHLVFDKENRSNLTQSFEIVAQTLRNVERTTVFLDTFVKTESGQFSYIIDNLDSLSNSLVIRTTELKKTFLNIEDFTDSLKQIPLGEAVNQFTNVLGSLSVLVDGVNQGEGSLGKLIVSDSLYYAIETTSLSLNLLLEDIKKNPKRYVRVSAIDRGKTFFLSDEKEIVSALAEERDLLYFSCITSSSFPLGEDDELFKTFRKAQTVEIGSIHYYYIMETNKFDKARRIVNKHIQAYPDAGVYTWLRGKWTRISL